jgi:hypothetical protein
MREKDNMENLTVPQLMIACRRSNIKCSGLKKKDYIKLLKQNKVDVAAILSEIQTDLKKCTRNELKDICKREKINGHYGLKKADLILLIESKDICFLDHPQHEELNILLSPDFKRCGKCKEVIKLSDFPKYKSGKPKPECRMCKRKCDANYHATFEGYIKTLLMHGRQSAEKRKAKGRIEAGVFELTKEAIIQKLGEQKGKCYYSSLDMVLKPRSDFQLSIERLDESQGYTIDNTVLICLEFQTGHHQWTKEKVAMIPELLSIQDNPLFGELVEEARNPERKRNECVNREAYNIRLRLKYLLNTAKTSTKRRNNVESRDTDNSMDIDFDFLADILKNQRGRCAYSNIPMNYISGDWLLTLERISSLRGYTKDNVVFIAHEFNGTDCSSRFRHAKTGSAQWSREKFEIFYHR